MTPGELIGRRLRQLREERGLTRNEVARRLRSCGPIVTRVEQGTTYKRGHNIATVLAYARVLGVKPSEVLCVLDLEAACATP
jgi:transcriptional regulator with XRE-family HTH domain